MVKSERSGASGTIQISFAIPTDEANGWRLKNGSITFDRGSTVGIEVKEGYIPHAKGTHGLTVTYCVFRSIETEGHRVTADVAMMTCINGRLMDSVDIAHGVEVILPEDMVETLASRRAKGITGLAEGG